MYATLYGNNRDSIADNRKFLKPGSLIYEAPQRLNPYRDETLEEKMYFAYPDPGLPFQNDVYLYRYDSFVRGNRDFDYENIPKILRKNSQDSGNILKFAENFKYNHQDFDIEEIEENSEKFMKENEQTKNIQHSESGVCGIDEDGVKNICGGNNLFPIMDPRFNLREAAKNMILLEDHLFHYGKRCHDCILKHCLTVEGFLEEGVTLDKKREYVKITNESLEEFRKIFAELAEKIKNKTLQDEECCKIAQQIRKIRKPLCQQFATFLK
jgi:hypothetical protein